MRRNNMLVAAAIGGGLYWASKQPGGIQGVWNRFSDKVKDISNSSDPLGTLKSQWNGIGEQRYQNAGMDSGVGPMSADTSASMDSYENGGTLPSMTVGSQQRHSGVAL